VEAWEWGCVMFFEVCVCVCVYTHRATGMCVSTWLQFPPREQEVLHTGVQQQPLSSGFLIGPLSFEHWHCKNATKVESLGKFLHHQNVVGCWNLVVIHVLPGKYTKGTPSCISGVPLGAIQRERCDLCAPLELFRERGVTYVPKYTFWTGPLLIE